MAIINGTSNNDQLFGTNQGDQINGLAGNDVLGTRGSFINNFELGLVDLGDFGDDTLDGGSGNDNMAGGIGNDTYIVDSVGDVVIETISSVPDPESGFIFQGGIDTVKSSVDFTLGNFVENLTLTGTASLKGTGNTLNNTINGNNAFNTLDGSAGDDRLEGQGGDDVLLGGLGNDTLLGGNGNDLLSGREGNDIMMGGRGNDRYVVDAIGDVVQELVGEGIDTVNSFIDSYSLTANVENLSLIQGTSGLGNDLKNQILGNNKNNFLSGAGGNDTLTGFDGDDRLDGGTGSDTLTGGAGRDTFHYDLAAAATGQGKEVDVITDFISGTDRLFLDFSGLSNFFESQITIVDSDQAAALSEAQLIYSKASGAVFFNENRGAGGFGTGGKFITVQGSVLTNDGVLLITDRLIGSPNPL